MYVCTGGDQLTVARGRGCQRIRSNCTRGKDQLESMTHVVEDWHANVSMLGVRTFMYMYILSTRTLLCTLVH